MTVVTRCPGLDHFLNIRVISIRCRACGKETELFSDELENRSNRCRSCGRKLERTKDETR